MREWTRDGWRGRAGLRRTRSGAARGRGARRGRGAASRGVPSTDSRAGAGTRHRHLPACSPVASSRPGSGSRCSTRPTSPAGAARRPGTCADADPAPAQHHRPAGAQARRPRGARAARHRPVRRDGAAHGQRRRRASTWSSSTPPRKRGQPGDRLFVPTDSLDQLSRYVGGETPTLHKMGGADWQKTKGRARKAVKRDRRRAHPALRGAHGDQGSRVRPGHAVAARARGRLPVHRDARPAGRDRRGQARHGADRPDGPADLRRRRLRQDRDRGAGGVQGGAGRQAGGRPGADDAAGPAALRHVLRADGAVPGHRRGAVPVPDAEGGAGDARAGLPTARSTSSSAPTGCCSRRPGSRTSAWSSSTRSSGSASSTRSTSSSCGRASTC